MNILEELRDCFRGRNRKNKNVALVLSGGGAKGWAHIGAIDSLIEHGYHISSIAGTSMGSLVGGLYAAGKMNELKQIATDMTRKRMLYIMGFSPGLDHIANGDRLMEMLDKLVGETRIEDLPIPYCCSASDLVSGEEVVFRKGVLKQAIRASISIPVFFKPVCDGDRIYVDGSVHNTLPLDRVERKRKDLLVAVNVSGPDEKPDTTFLKKYRDDKDAANKPVWKRLRLSMPELSANYMNITMRVTKLSIQNNTQMAMRLTPPDICADISMDNFNLFDFDKAPELIAYGKQKMDEVLQEYESRI